MAFLDKILDILRYALLDAVDSTTAVLAVFYLIGLCGVFVKCGLRGWWALVPVARVYKLALCADREQEGRTLTLIKVLMIASYICTRFLPAGSSFQLLFVLLEIICLPASVIYEVRVFSGLCRVFERKRRWVLLWLPAEWFPLAPLLWGFRKKYQPIWKAEEIRDDVEYYFSGRKATTLEQGLTVNLEERTAREFFKKKYLLRDIHMSIEPGHMVRCSLVTGEIAVPAEGKEAEA